MTHVDLSDNGLSTEGAVAVTNMMKENCYITYLASAITIIIEPDGKVPSFNQPIATCKLFTVIVCL